MVGRLVVRISRLSEAVGKGKSREPQQWGEVSRGNGLDTGVMEGARMA